MRGRLLVLVAVIALVGAGCRLDVDVQVSMTRDGSGTIAVTATADAELVAAAPGLATDLRLDDLTAAGWAVEGPAATEDGGLRVVLTHPFSSPADATALLASLNGTGGPFHGLTLTREVDGKRVTYGARGDVQLLGGIDAFADEQVRALGAGTPFASSLSDRGAALADAVGMSFAIELPVEADSTNGGRDGRTVRWDVPLDGSPARVEVTASRDGSSAGKQLLAYLALAVLVAWIVVAAAFLTYVARHRRPPRRAG